MPHEDHSRLGLDIKASRLRAYIEVRKERMRLACRKSIPIYVHFASFKGVSYLTRGGSSWVQSAAAEAEPLVLPSGDVAEVGAPILDASFYMAGFTSLEISEAPILVVGVCLPHHAERDVAALAGYMGLDAPGYPEKTYSEENPQWRFAAFQRGVRKVAGNYWRGSSLNKIYTTDRSIPKSKRKQKELLECRPVVKAVLPGGGVPRYQAPVNGQPVNVKNALGGKEIG